MTKPKHQTTDRGRAAAPIVVAQDQATAAVAAPADGEPVAPAPVIPAADEGGDGAPGGGASPSTSAVEPASAPAQQVAAVAAVAETAKIADAITLAATPVVRVTAVRDRWRAGRHWPKGDTDLTEAEAEQLGRAGFETLREDNVFTIVPLDRAD